MKKLNLTIFFINIFIFIASAQDRIIKTTKDTICCLVKEIGDEEVKYTQKDFRSDLIFGIDKNKVSRIIFSNGKELVIKDSMYDPSQYDSQHKNALKVGFLSPLFGATNFSYEHSLRPGSSIEATLGIIGLGIDVTDYTSGGVYVKFGYKFLKSPDFYLKGMRYAHILKGAYIAPEFSFATYNVKQSLIYNYSSSDVYPGSSVIQSSYKERNTMFAIMLNFGKQWVMQDRFLIDWYGGIGYGFGNSDTDDPFHFAFLGGNSGFPLAVSSGLRIGVLF